jgi:ABC-type bacteriocin/lantibiotic exporter with double-glycine peptidase domain
VWWLDNHLVESGPAILCVDDDEHWVTAIGVCQERFVVFDPARNTGVEIHDMHSLARRWVNSDGVYYALGIAQR